MGAAAAFQLASSNADFLTYLVTGDGAATSTTILTCTDAGAGADLISDLAAIAAARPTAGFGGLNPLAQVILAQQNGLGSVIAAGAALTQAQARQLFNSDGNNALGNQSTPRLRLIVTPRSGVAAWSIDVNVAAGNPIVTFETSAAAGTWMLRVEVATPRR